MFDRRHGLKPTTLIRPPAGLAVGILSILGATVPATAQTGGFLETLDVRVVNLEVYVSDRGGRPVEGLGARDFTLLEDGKKVPLSHFSVVGEPGAQAPDAAPAHVVLFFDNFAIEPQGRRLVEEDLRGYFESGAHGTALYAVASYDGYLRIHQGFTGDADAILAAVGESARLSPLGVLRRTEREALLRQGLETLRTVTQLAGDDQRVQEATRRLRNYRAQLDAEAERQRQLVQAGVFAMSHLVNALAALPGRKAVLYIGDGLPMRPGEELYAAVDEVFLGIQPQLGPVEPGSEQQDARIDMRSSTLDSLDRSTRGGRGELPTSGVVELAALANSGRVSFYTLRTESGRGGLPAEFVGEMRELFTPQLAGLRERNLAESLQAMADETGGHAVTGTGAGELLDRARADLASYYYLGFEPARPADGAYHKLKVKVRGRDGRLRYRSGYVDKPPVARIADRTAAAMLLGLDDNPLGIGVEAGAATPGSVEDRWVVPLTLSIPLDFLSALPAAGQPVPAHLFLSARDPEGRAAPVQQMQLELQPGAGTTRQTVKVPILLRAGSQRLGFGLVVPAAGAAAFVSLSVEPGGGAG